MPALVSIICTTYNEEKLIERTLTSFINQELDDMITEILVVDGLSEDRTRDIVKSFEKKYSNVRLIDNPQRKNPFGRNIGVKEAKGDYIALLGAHTIYAKDYIKVCCEEMQRTDSAGCSGKVNVSIEENSYEAKLCELLLTNKFAVSSNSFRTVREGYTSMVNYPVFKKEVFEKVGLYDTSLIRNQDNDFNQRVLNNGYKLYSTWRTECSYYPGDSLKKILAYSFKNGFWNAKTILKKSYSLKLYHFVPFIFVTTLILSGVLGLAGLHFFLKIFFLIIGLHLITGFFFSFKIKKYKTLLNILSLPFLFFAFHFSYGLGTLKGFIFPNKL